MCFRTRNCCAGDRRLRRIQGAGAGPRVAEAVARPKGRRLMRGTRARYRAARRIPVGSKFTPPVSAGGFFFYPRHRTSPQAACRPPLHSARKLAAPAQRHGGAKAPALQSFRKPAIPVTSHGQSPQNRHSPAHGPARLFFCQFQTVFSQNHLAFLLHSAIITSGDL